MLWEVINPLIQLSIYWFVFGFGIRGGKGVEGVPFIYWLSVGLLVWFFLNPAVLQSSKAIYTRIALISKINFPMSVIPSYVIASQLYQHLILTGVVMIGFLFTGRGISLHLLQLPYYTFAMVMMIFALSLITSTLATVVRDVQMIVQSVMRMMMYVTPILWTPDKLPHAVQKLLLLNPFYYIVEGYRQALLGTGWFYQHLHYMLYFWALVLLLLLVGSALHVKFRKQFVDYL